jgi:ketosteroid isomerase-like protein
MKLPTVMLLATLCLGCRDSQTHDERHDREELAATSEAIRSAFTRGDVSAILAYHHPNVMKALNYNKIIDGKDALKEDLIGTLQQVALHWEENRVESLLIHGDTAVEQTAFTIKGAPKNGGKEFLIKGRAQIVYVRYKDSPTGWASIRELIQPAP